MVIKKYWSLLKWATSAAAVCSITAISALATSCVANKDNNGDSQQSNISIKDESPVNQNVTVDSGTTLDLFVDASSSDGDLTYQWYINKNDNNGWTPISGATQNNYKVSSDELNTVTTETTWKYRVEIVSAKDPNDKIISNEYSVNITPKKGSVVPWAPLEPSKPITPSDSENYDTEEVPTALKFDYDKVNISDLSSAADLDFLYKDKITKKYERTANVGYYTTELEKQYGSSGFKYPSYDYNYESGKNRYLTLSNGVQINMMDLVFKERVTNKEGKDVKYSDAGWIKEQIASGELKAHPAAKKWYEQNVTSNTKAVEKQFTIGAVKTGLYSLGLYAPAGEVITLTFDDETFNLIKDRKYKGLSVVVNDNYWDNKGEKDSGRISNRYPFVSSTFSMDPSTNSIKFGSPFGGNISIRISSFLQDSVDALNANVKPLSFTVSGAVESLNYVHGYTTESDWNRQVQDVLDGVITAPSMSAMYSWSTMNIPFTARNKVAGKDIANIAYPYETFKKWNNFQFLSVYTAKSYSKMLTMKFCDDIWGGAGAWGGGHNVYIPISWAGNSFLSGVENFNIKTCWGLMHEMNHNYQQDNTMFKRMYHNKTNQMSMVNFSLISDMGRTRNENNTLQEGTTLAKPGWTYLSNSYGNLGKMTETNGNKEYTTYGALLFTIGARNYIEYTRWAAVNHRNNVSGWTGLKEIQALSKYFKVNLWPAFQGTYNYWHDSWPASYDVATEADKAIIKDLEQYSAVEFMGNLYAAGSYLYDGETKQYRYTGDVNAPYEISGYQDYVFDFGKYVNSSNKNFNWSVIKVDDKSKNGVPLKVEGKKVNYLASQASYNDNVDEFDVTIVPGNWEGKPNNYIPGYKWKIKVRNAIQDPKINLYTGVTGWNANSSNHADDVKKYLPVKSFYTRDFSDQTAYQIKDQSVNLLRSSFSFIAPSTGNYIFNSLWNNSITVYANNHKVHSSNSSVTSKTQVFEKHMNANEVVSFDVFVYNNNSACSFDFEVKSGDKTINLANSLLGFGARKAWQVLGSSYTFEMYRNDQRFLYKSRFEDYLSFTQNTNGTTLISNSSFIFPNKNLYTLTGIDGNNKNVSVSPLYNIGGPSVEIWSSNKLTLDVEFKESTKVGSLKFGHRTDNHRDYRPTNIKVIGVDENNNSTILYSGDYSSKISSRTADATIVNLTSVATVKTLKIELTNNTPNKSGLVLNWFSYSSDIYIPLNNNIAVDNNYIAKTAGWSFINNNDNDYDVTSSYGSSSLLTTTKYSAIDFNLKNTNGFRLIGSTTASKSVFDVYINDKIYQRDVKVGGTSQSNVELFKYIFNGDTSDVRVTIVNKSANPLIINFIQTYGNNGPVYTSPVIVKR